MVRVTALAILLVCTGSVTFAAETRYVTDQLVVSVRQNPADGAPVVASLRTGNAIEVLAEQGRYLQVRTEQGIQGFVPAQYFTTDPPAATLLTRSQKDVAQLKAELAAVGKERDAALSQLKDSKGGDAAVQKLQAQLEESEKKYQALAADAKAVLAVTQERDRLASEVEQLTADLDVAHKQGGNSREPSPLNWFVAGAAVLFFGWLLGKLSRQKRRY